MVRYGSLNYEIEIPEGVSISVKQTQVTVKGKMGTSVRDFSHTGVKIDTSNDKISLSIQFPRKKEKAMIGTVQAHLHNMISGVRFGYQYKMKIVFSHFPIRVKPEGNLVKIENLYGGRKARYAKVLPGVKVNVDGEDVIVEGIDKELVGQTCANIEQLTRQRGKRRQSPKTFMDGVYTYHRSTQIAPTAE